MADELTSAMVHIALALTAGPQHGYALIGEVDELSGGRLHLGPGTLYRSLQRMSAAGLISELHDADPPGDPRRRRYRLSAAGRTALAREAARLQDLVQVALARGVLPDHPSPHAGKERHA